MIGVDYNLFWELDPNTLKPFTKAFDLRLKVEDAQSWRAGMYIQQAIASSLNKRAKYPKKPFMYDGPTQIEMTSEDIKSKMMRNMKLINMKFRKEE